MKRRARYGLAALALVVVAGGLAGCSRVKAVPVAAARDARGPISIWY